MVQLELISTHLGPLKLDIFFFFQLLYFILYNILQWVQEVRWGQPNMMEAERRLLANALLDFSNQRFVLLSESCIPLFNFSTIYNYLIGSTKSFVEAYDLRGPVGRGRYSPRMNPHIRLNQWRKGSQWFEMDRNLALEVVADQKYFSLFGSYCKHSCYTDEHYLPTFVNIKFAMRNSNRSLTWVDWSKGGPHPARFMRRDVTIEFLERLRHGTKCEYNGVSTNICYLFARKFLPNALDRLLRFAPKIMQFNWFPYNRCVLVIDFCFTIHLLCTLNILHKKKVGLLVVHFIYTQVLHVNWFIIVLHL